MLSARVAVLVSLACVGLASCESTEKIVVILPPEEPVELVTWPHPYGDALAEKKTVLLQPEAPEHRRLRDWLASNQSGWRKLPFEKDTSAGIFVSFGDYRLHFHLRGVMLSTKGKTFTKDISEDEYSFLKPLVGI